jgi:hypothetical protein
MEYGVFINGKFDVCFNDMNKAEEHRENILQFNSEYNWDDIVIKMITVIDYKNR